MMPRLANWHRLGRIGSLPRRPEPPGLLCSVQLRTDTTDNPPPRPPDDSTAGITRQSSCTVRCYVNLGDGYHYSHPRLWLITISMWACDRRPWKSNNNGRNQVLGPKYSFARGARRCFTSCPYPSGVSWACVPVDGSRVPQQRYLISNPRVPNGAPPSQPHLSATHIPSRHQPASCLVLWICT